MILTLPLLETGVLFVNDIKLTLPPHDLAIGTTLLNGCTNFHTIFYLYLNMILPLVRSYGLISTPTLSPGKIRI